MSHQTDGFATAVRAIALGLLVFLAAAVSPPETAAGCGCAKPPPPRATVRPFVAHPDQVVTLFDDRLVPGRTYTVLFEAAADGSRDRRRARARMRRDLADGVRRPQLRVRTGRVALGPCRVSVWQRGSLLLTLDDAELTVAARPVPLGEVVETITLDGYRTGVGRDGTVYVPVDLRRVDAATTFTGRIVGFPMAYDALDVAMYNGQGFLMQVLDPGDAALFRIVPATAATDGPTLAYRRHEFSTFKREHRRTPGLARSRDRSWHRDGSYHVDHDAIVVAIHPTMPDGRAPDPGATPPFRLVVSSSSEPLQGPR